MGELEINPRNFLAWSWLVLILRERVAPAELHGRLNVVLETASFWDDGEMLSEIAVAALQQAATFAQQFDSDQAKRTVRTQILRAASLVSESPEADEQRSWLPALFDACLRLSRQAADPIATAAQFAELLTDVVTACPAAAHDLRPVVQQLCDSLPLSQSRRLWPLLLRLRALD